MKKFFLLVVLFIYTFSFAQNNYKYVIVPKKFSFFKEENKYNLNVVTKTFFEKEGFEVYFDTDEFPKDLAQNRCLALFASASENNSIFSTKIIIEIKDCYNKNIFSSDFGTSKQKDYQKAYSEAFREALSSMSGYLKIKATTVETSKKVNNELVESTPAVKSNNIINTSELRAEPTETGYDLVDYSGNKVFYLYATSLDAVFIASKEIYKGVLLKKVDGWFFEYDFEGKVYSEKVEVKF